MNKVEVLQEIQEKGGYCPNGWASAVSVQHAKKGDEDSSLEEVIIQREETGFFFFLSLLATLSPLTSLNVFLSHSPGTPFIYLLNKSSGALVLCKALLKNQGTAHTRPSLKDLGVWQRCLQLSRYFWYQNISSAECSRRAWVMITQISHSVNAL